MTRPQLLLIHGALGAAIQFDPLLPLVENEFDVHTLDLEGHARTPLKERPLRIEYFAQDVLEYLDSRDIQAVDIFGHSLGGQIGLHLAGFFPDSPVHGYQHHPSALRR